MGDYDNTISNSLFATFPDSKYYDLYTSTVASDGYKIGDATHETGSWYNDYMSFVDSSYPWFVRGGGPKNMAQGGVFHSYVYDGSAGPNYGARAIIKP